MMATAGVGGGLISCIVRLDVYMVTKDRRNSDVQWNIKSNYGCKARWSVMHGAVRICTKVMLLRGNKSATAMFWKS